MIKAWAFQDIESYIKQLKEYSVILTTSFYGMDQKIYMHDYVCFIAPIDFCVE